MQRLKSVGGICYATSFFFAANLFFKFNIGLSIGANLMIFITLGGLGFLLNLISYTKDKTGNPLSNVGISVLNKFYYNRIGNFIFFHFLLPEKKDKGR